MDWGEPTINHSERNLSEKTRSVFGQIRRCYKTRSAQIQWFNQSTNKSEWINLLNFRYGMSESEVAEDIKETGISNNEWVKLVKARIKQEFANN